MIKNILISQPRPADFEKSPYAELAKKHNVNIDFYKFFNIEPINATTFRKDRINILDHTAVILMSKNAIDHFFRISKELRIDIPESMKYFCINETTALYLQKYVAYRKRKIFFSKTNIIEFSELIYKHKNEQFLLPSGDLHRGPICSVLEKYNIKPTLAVIFKNVSADLKAEIDILKYEMIVLFSPSGVQSLKENYPDFNQGYISIGVMGENVATSLVEAGLKLQFMAPTKEAPSITSAIDQYIQKVNHTSKK